MRKYRYCPIRGNTYYTIWGRSEVWPVLAVMRGFDSLDRALSCLLDWQHCMQKNRRTGNEKF